MALSPAEKMRAYRERQKANNQKPVSFLLDADIAETVTSYAEQHQTNKKDAFNELVRQALSGNKLPNSDTVTSYQKEIDRLNTELATAKANNERLVLKYDSEYLRANGLQNQVTELKRQPDKLRAEITRLKHLEQDCQAIKGNGERCDKPAKGKVEFHGVLINVCLQHQNQLMKNSSEPEPKQQHQGETSEPLNLTPDKVFKYDYYGNERLIALFNDDSRVFFKDSDKKTNKWELFVGANSNHFTEKDNRFYFGNTEIYPVENFKGKLPKTLIMR